MKKAILKHVLAIALGGSFTAVGAATVDADHFGKSLKQAGTLALMGAVTAVAGLNTRAPKDE
jgi:hypothetical protein